jgi:ADP-dependent NAD(P)H-hydrate dehydratase
MPRPTSPEQTPVTAALLREWPIDLADREVVVIVGGARTAPGAVVLSGTAALRAGAGTLQLAASERHASALGVAVPESSVIALPETESGAISADAADLLADIVPEARAVVIGPGLSGVEETADFLEKLLPRSGKGTQVVLDAFALGALSRRPALAGIVAGKLLLTPNLTEAAFLLGQENKVSDYPAAAAAIARRYQAVVTLMGSVADPRGDLWVERSGHVGLSTSGSGDVLAGLVGGFLARSAGLAQAACWATYVHAMAGQRLIPRTGATGLLARELVDQVPQVIAELST